ncbi:MAG: hypothetical protein ABIK73_06705 [candidate division WOR-3 bacterium]
MQYKSFEEALRGYPDWVVVDVMRPVSQKVGGEYKSMRYDKVIEGLRAIIQPRSSLTHMLSVGQYPEMTHMMFCRDVDVRVNDEVVVGMRRYRVLGVDVFTGHHLEVFLKEVRS